MEIKTISHTILPNSGARLALDSLVKEKSLPIEAYNLGLKHFNVQLSPQGWGNFIYLLGSFIGILLLMAGLIFFMAWNWHDMPKFGKFGLVEIAFAGLSLAALWHFNSWAGRIAFLGLSLCTGALFAIYGQIYQTGAQAYDLFYIWALVLIPLALAGRQAALWFIFFLVATVAYILYAAVPFYGYLREFADTGYALDYCLSTFAGLMLWELASYFLQNRHSGNYNWLKARWLPRFVAFTLIFVISIFKAATIEYFVKTGLMGVTSFFNISFFSTTGIYFPLLLFLFLLYLFIIRDLFMLALVLFSLATIVTTGIIFAVVEHGEILSGLFLIALVVASLCFFCAKSLMFLKDYLEKNKKYSESGSNVKITPKDKILQIPAWRKVIL